MSKSLGSARMTNPEQSASAAGPSTFKELHQPATRAPEASAPFATSELQRVVRPLRRSKRIKVAIAAHLGIGGTIFPVTIFNISTSGAGILGCPDLRVADECHLQLPDGRTLPANVCWSRDGRCGLEFCLRLSKDDPLFGGQLEMVPSPPPPVPPQAAPTAIVQSRRTGSAWVVAMLANGLSRVATSIGTPVPGGLPRREAANARQGGGPLGWKQLETACRKQGFHWLIDEHDAFAQANSHHVVASELYPPISRLKEFPRKDIAQSVSLQEDTGSIRLLANACHEIRSNVSAIMATLDTLIEEVRNGGTSTDLARQASTARDTTEELLDILNTILLGAKAREGCLSPQSMIVSPLKVVGDVVEHTRSLASAKGLRLGFSAAADVPATVITDRAILRQLLLNMVTNAIKYTSVGGIHVRLEAAPGNGPATELRFAVKDTGIGISSSDLSGLFNRYARAAGVDPSIEGYGLGLSIAKEYASALGGEIWAESEPGEGSTFFFRLNCHIACPDAETLRHQPPTSATSRPLDILLAEDTATIRNYLKSILEKAGHRVDAMENGVQALQAARDKSYDIILLDGQMPVMGGPTAARLIRALPPPRNGVPIIALTASTSSEQASGFGPGDICAHLVKPVRSAQLLTAIGEAITAH